MARPLIPFVQNGYYASRNWIPLVKGNGFTTSGGGEQEEVWETASGSIVTFDAVAAPLRQLSVAVEPVQNLNGYDNPWPAGGGKNLIDMSWFTTRTVNDVTFTKNSDGSVTLSGTASSTINLNGTTFTLPAGTYTISGSISNNQLYLYDQGANTAIVESANGTSRTVTTTEDKTVYLRLRVGGGSTVSGTVKPQLEVGSTATSFAPYSNICPISGWDSVNIWDKPTHDTTATPTATIQLGETVYGGTLDVLTGVVTVTHMSTDLGDWTWTAADTGDESKKRMLTNGLENYIKKPPTSGTLVDMYCEAYKTINGNDVYLLNTGIGSNRSGSISVYDPNYNTADSVADFVASISGVKLVYPLATPFELTLTPEQISTLQGTNNVWSDAGDVTVEYRVQ